MKAEYLDLMITLQRMAENQVLNEKSIRLARAAIVGWDRWLTDNRETCTKVELEFHEMSIRYAKGVIKLWRVWLLQQPAQSKRMHGATAHT